MSSFRTENPAIAEMDRHLDQEAKDDQWVQDIEARARKMLTESTELVRLLEHRDEPKILVPLSNLVVTTLQYSGLLDQAERVGSKCGFNMHGPYGEAVAKAAALSETMSEHCRELYEVLLEDAQATRRNTGKSDAEALLDAERWDDGSPA